MSFNTNKCEVLRITNKRNIINAKYSIHGTTLKTVDEAKYLGVTIQSKLSWKPQINNICKKANSTRGFLQRNLRRCPATVKEQPYKTYVRPTLEYASTVWDPHHTDLSDQVDMVQRRAARFVKADFHQRHSVTKMLEDLKRQTLRERRAQNKATMVYRIVNGLVAIPCGPPYFIPSRSGFLQHHTAGYLYTNTHSYQAPSVCGTTYQTLL